MVHRLLLISLCIALFSLFSLHSSICPHGKLGAYKPTPNSIEGRWIVICGDTGGHISCSLPPRHPRMPDDDLPWEWKITKDIIAMGREEDDPHRLGYQLNPAVQKNAIDLFWLEKNEKGEYKKLMKMLGIYCLEGDYLMICYKMYCNTRPTHFFSTQENGYWIRVFRRTNQ